MEKNKRRILIATTAALIFLSCNLAINNTMARYVTDQSVSYVYEYEYDEAQVSSNCLSKTGETVYIGSLDEDYSTTLNIQLSTANSDSQGYFTIVNANTTLKVDITTEEITLIKDESQNIELIVSNTVDEAFVFEVKWTSLDETQVIFANFVYEPTSEISEEEEVYTGEDIDESATVETETEETEAVFQTGAIDLYKSQILELEFNINSNIETHKLIFYQIIDGVEVEFLPDYMKYSLNGGESYITLVQASEIEIPSQQTSILIDLQYCEFENPDEEIMISIVSSDDGNIDESSIELKLKDDVPILYIELESSNSIIQDSGNNLVYKIENYSDDCEINIYQFKDTEYNLIEYEKYFDVSIEDNIMTIELNSVINSGAYKLEIVSSENSAYEIFYIRNTNFVGGIDND